VLADSTFKLAPDGFEIIALAASAGGLGALTEVLSGLPAAFPVAVCVVQHLDRRHRSLMAEILGRRTGLRVTQAVDGERLQLGTVFIAPPDRHLLVNADATLSLTQTQLVHFVRPSADLLFESVAASFREHVIAVILSGSGQDGAMGAKAVKKMGGTVIVQDPEDSEFRGMPEAALHTRIADFVLPLAEIAPALRKLVGREHAP
jgi:two-component system chemotaxis response regulator CheB